MATTGGDWTGGNPPRNLPHKPAPVPLNAVAGRSASVSGDLAANRAVGAPVPQEVAIVVDGVNLVDLVATLQARITALETA
jgi:hypothetical protein